MWSCVGTSRGFWTVRRRSQGRLFLRACSRHIRITSCGEVAAEGSPHESTLWGMVSGSLRAERFDMEDCRAGRSR